MLRLPTCCLLLTSLCWAACDTSDLPGPSDARPDAGHPDLPHAGDQGQVLPADGGPPTGDGNGPLPADAAPVKPDAAQVLDNTLTGWGWPRMGAAVTDRAALATAFTQAGYTPPKGTFLMAARLEQGVDQPAVQYFSLGDTGFDFSWDVYWPASTVKLTAAVGALWTLGNYGLSGAAQISFTDSDGSYSGTVQNIYHQALSVSNNVAYNRLVEIAGFDELNDSYLVPAHGLPQMVLQRRYTKTSDLRTSPAISYSEGSKSGTIPQRVGTGQHPSCPYEANCITLFELMDVIRRVTLHDEIPQGDRFPITGADVAGLKAALLASSTSYLEPGASQALGHTAQIFNKPGAVWDYDRLDHALIVDPVTGERYLIAWSMPYNVTSGAIGSELTRQTLLAMRKATSKVPALQRDAGASIAINVKDNGPGASPGSRSHTFTIQCAGADGLDLWLEQVPQPKAQGSGPIFTLTRDLISGGERLLLVRARAGGKAMAYRAAVVQITNP